MENILSGKKRKRPEQDTTEQFNMQADYWVEPQKVDKNEINTYYQRVENPKERENEETKTQKFIISNTKLLQRQKTKLKSKKALLELPDDDTLIKYFKDYTGLDIDAFKAWYLECTNTFTSIDPLITEDYVLNSKIVTKTYTTSDGRLAYYKGEVNDQGQCHGAGLVISPFTQITEGYYKDGHRYGERKYVKYQKNRIGQAKFKFFKKYTYFQGMGYYGYYQVLSQNGHLIKDGYQKNLNYSGERKRYDRNFKQYGKRIERNVDSWY